MLFGCTACVLAACGDARTDDVPDGSIVSEVEEASSDSTDEELVADTRPHLDRPSPPPFDCPVADYVITIELPDGKRELRHDCGWYSDRMDVPAAFVFHDKGTISQVAAACATHEGGSDADFINVSLPPRISFYTSSVGLRSTYAVRAPTVDFTRWDAVGGIAEGTYEGDIAAELVDGGPVGLVHVRGFFRACRVPDWYFFE